MAFASTFELQRADHASRPAQVDDRRTALASRRHGRRSIASIEASIVETGGTPAQSGVPRHGTRGGTHSARGSRGLSRYVMLSNGALGNGGTCACGTYEAYVTPAVTAVPASSEVTAAPSVMG
jgi:hypothetical protein